MKNLEELEKKYAELGKEIQALKENEIKYPIYFEVKYPIYCKSKLTGIIVKFDSLKSGIVVKKSYIHDIGYKGNNLAPHTNTDAWEQLEVDEETGFLLKNRGKMSYERGLDVLAARGYYPIIQKR